MGLQWITSIAVKAKSFAPGLFCRFVSGYDLGYPLEAAEKQRHLMTHVDKDIIMVQGFLAMADMYIDAVCVIGTVQAVRQKTLGAEGPQQLVDPAALVCIVRMDIDLVALFPGLFRQAANELLTCGREIVFEDIKVDLGHRVNH